ncbi:ATP-dependent helicase [Micrococcus luteus]
MSSSTPAATPHTPSGEGEGDVDVAALREEERRAWEESWAEIAPEEDTGAARLRGPDAAEQGPRSWTDEQEAVASLTAGHGAVLVLGGPGTGRSSVLVEAVARRLEAGLDPESVLVLAPTRQAAARLRDALTVRLESTGHGTRAVTPVRTWSSYAFDLIRRARVDGPLKHLSRPPRLLSGAEQDTVIAELLEGYADGTAVGPVWPASVAEAVGTRGFRREVRELVDRMSEFGVEPGDLQELGARHGRPEWTAAATLVQDYRDRIDLGMAEAFDPAGLISAAVRVLTDADPEDPEHTAATQAFAEAERRRLRLVVVDDLHEATPAVHDLLAVVARGTDALLSASPESTVQGFRGAVAREVGAYPQRLDAADPARPSAERVHVLTQGHRMSAPVLEAWERVARRVATGSADAARVRELTRPADVDAAGQDRTGDGNGGASAAAPTAEVHVVPTAAHEDRFALQRILQVHHGQGVPLQDIAVIARSGGRVAELTAYLESEGVPVVRDVAGTVLKDEPAVAPLLHLLGVVAALVDEDGTAAPGEDRDEALADVLDALDLQQLLRGRYGNTTPLHLRRLRQDLLAAERARGGRRGSEQLLPAALLDPDLLGEDAPRHHGLQRLSRMLHAGLDAAREAGATAETVLWALWSAAERGEAWRRLALGKTDRPDAAREGRRADADLDAVVALFQTVERYVDQFPGAAPAAFSRYMESQDLPMDSLARGAAGRDAVHVLTPASAAGRGWHTVLVVGIQDGVWPNTRLRGQLLGATDLADLVLLPEGADWPTPHRIRLQETRQDELRTFAAAVSRARHTVVGTAVVNHEATASEFLELIARPTRTEKGELVCTDVPDPLTTAALVARLRRTLEGGGHVAEGPAPSGAAAGLAWLAAQGIRTANPEHWWGLAPLSTDEPVMDAGGEIRLSPSRAQMLLQNPLDWIMSEAGAEAATSLAQSVGTFVHSVCEAHPDGPPQALREEVERRLPELGLPEGWTSEVQFERARELVETFIRYLPEARVAGRVCVAQEIRIDVPVPLGDMTVRITGVIDRLEVDAEGRPYVVDLKTGRSAPTKEEMLRQPQLAAYQVALAAGALDADGAELPGVLRPTESGGAALVQLGAGTQKVKVQDQPALGADDEWARDQLALAAGRTVGPFYLTLHRAGDRCRHAALCPLCSEGRQVTEWTR